MRNKIRKLLIFGGVLLLSAAVAICIYNVIQDKKAYRQSREVMAELRQLIPATTAEKPTEAPTNPADDLFAPYEQEGRADEPPAPLSIDGRSYCGYVSLPSLGLELPVIDKWSYEALDVSPCRFSGSAAGNDLIIAAHNYSSHFGRIADISIGDDILFTDTAGTVNRYSVDDIRVLEGSDSDGMFYGRAEEWDITLFTCTLSGKSRVAVRGCRVPEGAISH